MCDYKNKTCNFCENVQINRIKSSDRYNIYCNYNDVERMVDLSVPPKAYVEIPSWCPKNKKVASSALSFADKMSLLRKMTPLIKWDEIEVNTVYHLPQLPGEERNDIIVTRKDSASLTYREIGGANYVYHTIYPESVISRFLVKNKIKKYIVKQTTK